MLIRNKTLSIGSEHKLNYNDIRNCIINIQEDAMFENCHFEDCVFNTDYSCASEKLISLTFVNCNIYNCIKNGNGYTYIHDDGDTIISDDSKLGTTVYI